MKLILTRHGETIENQKRIMQGHLPGHLSKQGIEQAKKLALRLKDEKIDAIYSSDLARAADTAREIAEYHKKIPINFVQELRETNLGSLTGKCSKYIDFDYRPDDVESTASMQKRTKKLLDKVYNKYPDKTVLFVGHNGINKALISVILNKPAKDMDEIESQLNTSISIFEIKEDKKHIVHLMNCTKHLE
ncbi:MAG: histidine phosphatase family protein [Nanoarchaeota archaeon]|nr:histidine phosphatase family protein [Nanoarchaeota archaeon]